MHTKSYRGWTPAMCCLQTVWPATFYSVQSGTDWWLINWLIELNQQMNQGRSTAQSPHRAWTDHCWYHSTLCGHPLSRIRDDWKCSAAGRHTSTSISQQASLVRPPPLSRWNWASQFPFNFLPPPGKKSHGYFTVQMPFLSSNQYWDHVKVWKDTQFTNHNQWVITHWSYPFW